MHTKTYSGLLSNHRYGSEDEILLFLSSIHEPLCEELLWMNGKKVSVRYWITDTQVSKEDAQNDHANQVMGIAKAKFGARYSEMTGYLWTDEELNVGGHDLIDELDSATGQWLILEVDYD